MLAKVVAHERLERLREFRVAPGGHMGVIIGSKSQNAVWKESAAWLAPRSEAKPLKKKRKAPARKAKASVKTKAKAKAKPRAKVKAKAKVKPKLRA